MKRKLEPADLEVRPNPKPQEVVVWRFSIEDYNVEDARQYYDFIQSMYPNNKVIALPFNSSLEEFDREELIRMLSHLIEYIK